MKTTTLHLSRPVYEGLPWIYVSIGVFALIVSYGQTSPALSLIVGLPGLIALMAGIVVLLKRRDYRAMRARYEHPDALSDVARAEVPREETSQGH